ncbi:MAG: T9SS type A sorting domain-containing protein [Candidatus Coatesbacteria bacterium]|nr:T9SS type A sorting domain-containing protein [Candidatus Coatesbacteria bacterium]
MRILSLVLLLFSFSLLLADEPVFLLTGFDKWGGASYNIAWESIAHLDSTLVEGYRIHCVKIPVEWRRGLEVFLEALDKYKPVYVMSYGSGYNNASHVEHVAKNRCGHHKDEAQEFPPSEYCVPGGPAQLSSTLPCSTIVDSVNSEVTWEFTEAVAAHGYNAGDYLCNYIFYHLMYYCQTHPEILAAGFIHVRQDTPIPIAELCRDIEVRVVIREEMGFGKRNFVKAVPRKSNQIKIYPNPARKTVNVSFSLDHDSSIVFKLIDMNGRIRKAWFPQFYKSGTHNFTANTSLPQGRYFLHVTENNSTLFKYPFVIIP